MLKYRVTYNVQPLRMFDISRLQCKLDQYVIYRFSALNLYAKSSRSNSKLTAEMTKRRCTFYAVHILRYICARFAFYCMREEQIFSPPDTQSKLT